LGFPLKVELCPDNGLMKLPKPVKTNKRQVQVRNCEYKRLFSKLIVFNSTDIDELTVQSCPRGYPALAAFFDSDESFMVYRRFGYIQSRLLLEKQDEMRALE
jgi:hypothetical protein